MATLSGTTKDGSGNPISRLVRVYKRSTGLFVGASLSDPSTGAWSVTTTDTSEHFAIAHDDAGNPLASKLVLGLHCNGTNASTTFTDVVGNTVTALGNAQLATAQSFLGSSSIILDGTGDGFSIPDSSALRAGTQDFSLRFALRWVSKTGYQTIFSKGYGVAGAILVQTGSGDGKLSVYQGAGTNLICSETTGTVNTSQWYDMEIERSGGYLTIRRDGTTTGSASNSTDFSATTTMYFGGGSATGFNNYYFNGYIDEIEYYIGSSALSHTTRAAEFLYGPAAGTENALIYDRLVPV